LMSGGGKPLRLSAHLRDALRAKNEPA